MEPQLQATPIGEKEIPLKHRLYHFQLEEEMDRQQGKNTLNNIEINTAS